MEEGWRVPKEERGEERDRDIGFLLGILDFSS